MDQACEAGRRARRTPGIYTAAAAASEASRRRAEPEALFQQRSLRAVAAGTQPGDSGVSGEGTAGPPARLLTACPAASGPRALTGRSAVASARRLLFVAIRLPAHDAPAPLVPEL